MTTRDFCYWLQGFFELQRSSGRKGSVAISIEQSQDIENHLRLVFQHDIDPSIDGGDHAKAELYQKIHDGTSLTKRPPGLRC